MAVAWEMASRVARYNVMLLNAMVVGCELERAKSKHNLSRLVVVLAEWAQLTQTTVLWRAHPLSKSLWWCVLSKLPSICVEIYLAGDSGFS